MKIRDLATVGLSLLTRGASSADLKPGDVAPDFSLAGSDGRTYKLSEQRGKAVVLAWFPKAATSG